jgi:DNA replicative helicase MCM subunit Mcm2 (Cdc46/Mcm family)
LDDRPLRNVTKNSPAHATEAHISVIGHITQDELKGHLTETEAANGFANRFLFVCVRRSKLLPEGGQIQQVDFADFNGKLADAIQFAKQTQQAVRDEEARQRWIEVYPALSEGRPGLFGALTARSEAQVVRLSLIYALLDKSAVIRREHLEAGLAVWEYAEASVRNIFGQATGNPDADRILGALRNSPSGLTQTEISNVFKGNYSANRISQALEFLKGYDLVKSESHQTGGRPGTTWKIS